MTESGADFVRFYLRAIGVHTPVDRLAENFLRRKKSRSRRPGQGPRGDAVAAAPLDDLAQSAASCKACALAEHRTQVVFGVGDPHADIIFIGEAPGREEDIRGEPFVGRAGKLLDKMLAALGFSRQSVYIMNVVKCRPPGNRDPRPEEMDACAQWFDAQWDAIAPKIVCLLGRVAAQRVLQTDAPLSALRGHWHVRHGVPIRVTYHPAYLLRSPAQKARAWEDLRQLNSRYRAMLQSAD